MATDHSRALSRSVRRGTVATVAMPAGAPPTGVFTESEGPADGQAMSLGNAQPNAPERVEVTASDVFDQFFGSGASAPAAELDELASLVAQEQVSTPEARDASPVTTSAPAPVTRAPAASSATAGYQSRAARFRPGAVTSGAAVPGAPGSEPQPEISPAQPGQHAQRPSRAERFRPSAPAETPAPSQEAGGHGAAGDAKSADTAAKAPASPAKPSSERPWRQFVDTSRTREAVTMKQSMAAAKVLTPLVAAVSFAPGSDSPGAKKSKALSDMLVGVHHVARETAEAISDQIGKDVPSWMVTQLMQGLSVAIATHWQRGEGADMAGLAENMRQIFSKESGDLAELVRGASEDAYVEVDHPDIARFRISVSSANAAWSIYDWVTHPKLQIAEEGDSPSRFFSYGQPLHELVTKILTRVVNECRGLVAQVESADLRTAHMQSAIARMSNLVGSEYVTQTRRVMDWIRDPSISEDAYKDRYASAERELDDKLLPQIIEYARVNFLRIEQGAFRAIEELYEKSKAPEASGAGGPSRPAAV